MNKKIAYAIPVLIVAAIILCGSLRFGVVSLFITIPVAIIVGIAMIIYDKRLADNAVPIASPTLQDSVGTYGEPDDIIVPETTRPTAPCWSTTPAGATTAGGWSTTASASVWPTSPTSPSTTSSARRLACPTNTRLSSAHATKTIRSCRSAPVATSR